MRSIPFVLLIALPWLNPFSPGPTPAVVSILMSWVFASAAVLIYFSRSWTRQGHSLSTMTTVAWCVAAAISAILGLLQYFQLQPEFGMWINSAPVGESFANLRQRNQFATLTNIGLAALMWGACGAKRTAGCSKKVVSYGVTLVTLMLIAGNVASASRTGFAQLLLLLGLTVVWRPTSSGTRPDLQLRLMVLAIVAYLVLAYAVPVLAGLDPFKTGPLARVQDLAPACTSRLVLWSNVLFLIEQKPWLGWGWRELDFAHFTTLYPGMRFCDILDNAHNLPLHVAVELGVPFALALCAAGLWLVLRARPWAERDARRQMAWAVLGLIGLHSLLEYPLWYGPFQIAVGLCVVLLWKSPVPRLPAPRWIAWAATFLIVICGVVAWDYWRISQLYLPVAERSSAYRDNTLGKLKGSWMFKNQVDFAELTTQPLTTGNAEKTYALALRLLHFSPEPRVIEKLIESAAMLGRDDEATYYLARYRAAFPQAYEQWSANSVRQETP